MTVFPAEALVNAAFCAAVGTPADQLSPVPHSPVPVHVVVASGPSGGTSSFTVTETTVLPVFPS